MTAVTELPTWFEPRLPVSAECSPGALLWQRAAEQPDKPFVKFDDGTGWSQAQTRDLVEAQAERFAAQGLRAGDRIIFWLPNGAPMLLCLLAAWRLGLVPVPLNPALRGNMLANILQVADARLAVIHPDLIEQLPETGIGETGTGETGIGAAGIGEAGTGTLSTVIVPGALPAIPARLAGCNFLAQADCPRQTVTAAAHLALPQDMAALVFSSGTTGLSKAVVVTFGQLWTLGRCFYGYMTPTDRMLLVLPLFHIASLGALFGTLAAQADFAMTESFRASNFWQVLRATGATTVPGLGRTLVEILVKSPPAETDGDNPLRCVVVQSPNPLVRQFAARFNCDYLACYSMTETSCIAMSELNSTVDGSFGKPRRGIEVRLVDGSDIEVPPGQPGEIIVRATLPWVLNSGYFRNPEATVAAWRNGWFHTGDVARQDEHGNLYYVDRTKDIIRRRSENISSTELEAEIRLHPSVRDAAVIGVETPDGEEVLAIISAMPGHEIDPHEVLTFLIGQVPHYMVPRFIRVLAELPKTTGTERVKKMDLRAEGLTADCWDRETAGIVIKSKKLSRV